MRFDVAINHLIKNNTDIAAAITGIYPVIVPANVSAQVLPVLVYNQVSTSPVTTKDSFNDYDRSLIQLSIFCKSLDKCLAVAELIRTLLDRYSGTIAVGDTGYVIDLIRFQNQEFVGFDEDNNVFMIAQDYLIAMVNNLTFVFGGAIPCGYPDAARTNTLINIEDFPLLWIEGNSGAGYYDDYKADVFEIQGTGCVYGGGASDYAAITAIYITSKSLTTNFTAKLMSKFINLEQLRLAINSIEILDVSGNLNLFYLKCDRNDLTELNTSNNPLLHTIICRANNITSLDLSNNPLLTYINAEVNDLDNLDISNNPLLNFLVIRGNNLDDLDISNNPLLTVLSVLQNNLTAAVNSQLLIDLDIHGLSNGNFTSDITGGGSLTSEGAAAKSALQGKGWNIIGL
jgi:hypothetical protein